MNSLPSRESLSDGARFARAITALSQKLRNVREMKKKHHLKDPEMLVLAMLDERGKMIVGEIQQKLGILPAQMSRFARNLEGSDRNHPRTAPLTENRINPKDKRKIDVTLTDEGTRVLTEILTERGGMIDKTRFAARVDNERFRIALEVLECLAGLRSEIEQQS